MVKDVLRISLPYPRPINHYFVIKYKGNNNEEKPKKAFFGEGGLAKSSMDQHKEYKHKQLHFSKLVTVVGEFKTL